MSKFNKSLFKISVTGSIIGFFLAACIPATSPVSTSSADDQLTPEGTTIIEFQESPTASATEESDVEATATLFLDPQETAQPTHTAEQDQMGLTVQEILDFSILNQFGGVPNAVAVDGEMAYVGFGPRLLVLDVGDPANPRVLGQSETLRDIVNGVDVTDGLAFVAAGRGGLVVLDTSDPSNIQALSQDSINTEAVSLLAKNVDIEDSIAYVVYEDREDTKEIWRFDVSDPQQVAFLDSYAVNKSDAVVVDGGLIAIAGDKRLQLIDAADPDTFLGQIALTNGSYASRPALEGDIVTVVQSGSSNGVEQFDVSDPTAPVEIGRFVDMDMFITNHAVVDGDTLVTEGTFGEFGYCGSTIHVIHLGPDEPSLESSFDPENCINDITIQDDFLFVAGNSGLQIYNVSNPSGPQLESILIHPDGFQDAQSLILSGGKTYVLSSEGRGFDLMTLDLNLAAPDLLRHRLPVGPTTLGKLLQSGRTLIAPVWRGGFNTIDISDPEAPVVLHSAADDEFTTGDYVVSEVVGDVLYTSIARNEPEGVLGIIDLGNPVQPVLVATQEIPNWMIKEIVVSEAILYVLSEGESTRIQVLDISEPLAPRQIGELDLAGSFSHLAVVGDTLYAACELWACQSLVAIDVSDPQVPKVKATHPLTLHVSDMVLDDQGLIYMGTYEDGIWVLDASDPERLFYAGHLELAGFFAQFVLQEDKIYAANLDGGVYEIQVDRVDF